MSESPAEKWLRTGIFVLAAALFLWGLVTSYHKREKRFSQKRYATHQISLTSLPDGRFFTDSSEKLVPAEVVAAIDGDTLDITIKGRKHRLRYFGVDAPERGEPCYDEALLGNRELSGKKIQLGFDDRQTDSHGRLLAYVFNAAGESLDARLIMEGKARAWRRDGQLRGLFIGLEEEARLSKEGCLWGTRPKGD